MITKLSALVILLIFGLIVYIGCNFNKSSSKPAQITFNNTGVSVAPSLPTPTITPTPTPDNTMSSNVQIVFTGVNNPDGVGYYNNTLYVSSLTDNAVYKLDGTNLIKISSKGSPQYMYFSANGTMYAPLSSNNNIMVINTSSVTSILSPNGLSSPTGFTEDSKGNIYITDFSDNELILYDKSNNKTKKFIGSLSNPSGVYYSNINNNLYIANNFNNTITRINLNDGSRQDIHVKDLQWLQNVYFTQDKRLLVSGIKDNRGVIAQVNPDNGSTSVIINTYLPDPIMTYFSNNGYVYMVSPNDLAGRILKAKY